MSETNDDQNWTNRQLNASHIFHRTLVERDRENTMRAHRALGKLESFKPVTQEHDWCTHKIKNENSSRAKSQTNSSKLSFTWSSTTLGATADHRGTLPPPVPYQLQNWSTRSEHPSGFSTEGEPEKWIGELKTDPGESVMAVADRGQQTSGAARVD
jgi:hypothetical protein